MRWELIAAIAAAAVVLAVVLIVVLKKRKRKKLTRSALDAPSPKPVEAPPEVLAKIDAKLAQASQVHQASRTAGGPGVHLLPWTMLVGMPGAGKTTLLRRARLEVPFSTGTSATDLEIAISRNGTILDVPGAWLADDAGREHASWRALLRRLERARRPMAIETLIAVVDLGEVIAASIDQAEALATRLRRRLHEAMDTLGWRVPVYLVFSKADRLPGFVESFGVLPSSDWAQPLGFVLDGEEEQEKLHAELGSLIVHVRTQAHGRLARLDPALRPAAYGFPEQLAAAAPSIEGFVKRLREPSAAGDRVLLRGVCFASGAQDGTTIDKVGDQVRHAFQISGAAGSRSAVSEARSFFLHSIFTRLALVDVGVASRSVLGRARYVRSIAVAVALGLVGALLVTGASTLSYGNNKALLESSMQMTRALKASANDDKHELLPIAAVADRLEELEAWEAGGPPLTYRFGFYTGSQVLPPLRRAFERTMESVFLDRVGPEIESMLGDRTDSGDIAADYDALRAYLLLTTEKQRLEADLDFAAGVLASVWKRRLDDSASKETDLLMRLSRAYVRQIMNGGARWRTPSQKLVADARGSLIRRNAEYERIVSKVKKVGGPRMGLRTLNNNVASDALRSTAEVERLFTLEGWRAVRGSFEEEPEGAVFWVLGTYANDDEMVDAAREHYLALFAESWRRFLRGLSVKQTSSLIEARKVLEELTAVPPMVQVVLKNMKLQMAFPTIAEDAEKELGDAGLKIPGQALFKKLKARVKTGPNSVQQEFQPLFDLVEAPAGQTPGVTQWLNELRSVKAALDAYEKDSSAGSGPVEVEVERALRTTERVLEPLPDKLREMVRPILVEPLSNATAKAETERYTRMQSSFSSKVCDLFYETLADRYPFQPSGEDALLDAVTEVFGPTGAAWSFYDGYLKDDLQRIGDTFEARGKRSVPPEIVAFYQKALLVRNAMYPPGGKGLEREILVKPLPVISPPGSGVQISAVSFELGGEKRTYRFGPQETWSYVWPTKIGTAKLGFEGRGDLAPIEANGEWALFRLADSASIKQLAGGWVELRFSLKGGAVEVPIQLRAGGGTVNPLLEYKRFRLTCPRSTERHAP